MVLAIVFSSLAGCTRTAPAVDTTKKTSGYPPLSSEIAQADIKNLDGTTFKLADKKGKVLLLNMWATWCGPCRSEMPALVKMQETYRDQGFEVIGLNTDDESAEDITAFNGKMNLNYSLVWADTGLQASLLKISNFDGIPQSFLVDRDGNLRAVFKSANPAEIVKMKEWVGKVVNGEETVKAEN